MEMPQDFLELDSQLPELARVRPWVESIADRNNISPETRFAIHLCMEEALANVVLHGYHNQPGNPILIRSLITNGNLQISIEDRANPFEPVAPSRSSTAQTLESVIPGGNGIHLLHQFAGSLEYRRLPAGNQLTMTFPIRLQPVL